MPNELAGLLPTRDYMNRRYTSRGWSRGHLLNLALGQGDLLTTPIQLAVYINKIATKGNTFIPHFLLSKVPEPTNSMNLNEQTWIYIQDYLLHAVTEKNGTGSAADPKINGTNVYGKTGTAQNPHGDDHAWFVGYAKNGNQMASTIILVENGGGGGKIAAPIARIAFEHLFNKIIENRLAVK